MTDANAVQEECVFCGAPLTQEEDELTMGLVCAECIENNEWSEDD